MKAIKILTVLVAVVAIAGVADVWANCGQTRVFRSSGTGGANVRAAMDGAENAGNEIGRFWQTENANGANNFDGNCPSSLWWKPQPATSATQRIIDGILTGGGCSHNGCPSDGGSLTVVVEDYDTNGPPGVNGTAYYSAWAVTETPGGSRWYDFAQVDGLTSATNLEVFPFPEADVDSSARNGAFVEVTVNYAEQSGSAHSWLNGGVAPTTALVKEWHLMKATGTADPGRDRTSWVKIDTIQYTDDGASVFKAVECTDEVQDEYLAVGIGFNGGAPGGSQIIIDSALVGPAVSLECNPNLADPNEVLEFEGKKPSSDDVIQAKPRRSGGRR